MRALLDACVLYPTVLREILLGVAREGLLEPFWSARIEEEWVRAAARRRPEDEVVARGEIAELAAVFPGARVVHDPAHESRLWLPDPADIHVLASAIEAGADAIVTFNLRDFPRRELDAFGLRAIHPDEVLRNLWLDRPEQVSRVVEQVRARAENLSGEKQPLRPLLKRAKLPRLAKALS